MTPLAAKVIWLVGVVGWFIIRYPHDRRARRTPKLRRADRGREIALMAISATGLGVLPFIYVVGDAPHFANYPFRPWQAWLGAAVFAASLWLFHRTHKDLGRNWSVTLEVRDRHTLVTNGVYSRVRHPMYSAFWRASAFIGVSVKPGPIALTRMPIGPSSIARALVKRRTPPFEVV